MHLKITLLCDEWLSSKGGISTINRELAMQLSTFHNLKIRLFMPKCSEAERELVKTHKIKVFVAKPNDPEKWWNSPPPGLKTDFIIGHGAVLGKAAPDLKKCFKCKWIQVVHHDPEEIGNYKEYPDASKIAENKLEEELYLCELADLVIAIGPKLFECFSARLRPKKVFQLTPAINKDFSTIQQVPHSKETKFRVLTFGRGEDVKVKGYDIAAQAIAKLNKKTYSLIVVGVDDESRDRLRKRLLKHKISENQLKLRRFKTQREELGKSFTEVELMIMPSRTEGFGLSALEALSAGLPILVSSDSGFGESLKGLAIGSSCVVNPEANADNDAIIEEWAKKIKEVHEKPRSVRLKEAEQLRKHYDEKYSWAEQCEALVKDMLSLHRGDRSSEDGKASGDKKTILNPSKRRKVCGSDVPDEDEDEDEDDDDYHDDDDIVVKPSTSATGAHPPASTSLIFKRGTPPDDELDDVAGKIVSVWQKLGIRLKIPQYKLEEIASMEKDPAYKMLIHWKKAFTSKATYEVLYHALCHERVSHKDVAEDFCCL